MTKESLDAARFQVNNDKNFERIGYILYGKFFKKKYFLEKIENGVKITDVDSERSNVDTSILLNDKILSFLYSSPYYRYTDFGSNIFVVFKDTYIICFFLHYSHKSEFTYANVFEIYSDDVNSFSDFVQVVQQSDFVPEGNPKTIYKYVLISDGDFVSKELKLECNYNVDLNETFNDDLPILELDNFVNKNSCGLSLFHGKPGCGKSTFIKNLIYKHGVNKSFYILDACLLGEIVSEKFVKFLSNCSESIFIIEDCEKLLMDRETCNNPWIGTLLNLTDGILGESLKIKFICTFNCDLKSIDKALLREGRLDVLYEFKPLSEDKGKALCEKLGKTYERNMTLAEIYKSKIKKSSLNKEVRKIGF